MASSQDTTVYEELLTQFIAEPDPLLVVVINCTKNGR